ncbi:hypothetical protein YC2023_113386 [Brassica napus]
MTTVILCVRKHMDGLSVNMTVLELVTQILEAVLPVLLKSLSDVVAKTNRLIFSLKMVI